MVKVEDSPKPLLRHIRAQSQAMKKIFKNRDLPEGCTIGDCWCRAFIMTYIWWAAQQHDPWNMNDDEAVLALQWIFNTIYDMSVTYTIMVNDAIFSILSSSILSVDCHTYHCIFRHNNVCLTPGIMLLAQLLSQLSTHSLP